MTQSSNGSTSYLRVDASSELGEPERTEEGYLVVPGVAASVGVLEYEEPDGSIRRELVTEDALEDPSSLIGKPVTLEHPPEGEVNPKNFKKYVVGEVVKARFDEETGEQQVQIRIKDAEAIRAVRSGARELSPGYRAKIEKTSGEHPEHGEYDLKQVSRVNNHLAITAAGRGGKDAAITRLDSKGNVVISQQKQDQNMAQENEDNDERNDDLSAMREQMKSLTDTVNNLVGLMASSANGGDEGGEAEPQRTDEEDEEDREDSDDFLSRFQARQDALATAEKLDVDVDENAATLDIKRAVVEAKASLRNDSEAHVEAAYDLITNRLEEDTEDEDEQPRNDALDAFGEDFAPIKNDSDGDGFDPETTNLLRPGEEPAQAELRKNLSGGRE